MPAILSPLQIPDQGQALASTSPFSWKYHVGTLLYSQSVIILCSSLTIKGSAVLELVPAQEFSGILQAGWHHVTSISLKLAVVGIILHYRNQVTTMLQIRFCYFFFLEFWFLNVYQHRTNQRRLEIQTSWGHLGFDHFLYPSWFSLVYTQCMMRGLKWLRWIGVLLKLPHMLDFIVSLFHSSS